MVALIWISFLDGTSIITKINIWTPKISKTVVKSILQNREYESNREDHEGGANFVLGGTNPFSLRILRAVFFETPIPISFSSSEILWAPHMELLRLISIMRSMTFSWMGGLPGDLGSQMIFSLLISLRQAPAIRRNG